MQSTYTAASWARDPAASGTCREGPLLTDPWPSSGGAGVSPRPEERGCGSGDEHKPAVSTSLTETFPRHATMATGRLSSGVAGRGEGDRGHGLREEGPTASQVVLFFDPRFGPSFSLIAAATKCMSTMSCVTQYTLRRWCSSFGTRVANCVQ